MHITELPFRTLNAAMVVGAEVGVLVGTPVAVVTTVSDAVRVMVGEQARRPDHAE